MTEPRTLAETLNRDYEALHTAKEDAFWAAYMGLTDDADAARSDLDTREIALKRWVTDPAHPATVRAALATLDREPRAGTDETRVALTGWLRTFEANAIESAEARALAEEIVHAEGRLARSRAQMALGYAGDDGTLVPASSVKLGLMVRSDPSEPRRKAAWEGLRSIETHVLGNGFVDLVKQRNAFGRLLGGEDYYDATTRRVEGLSKREIFAWLDELEARTRDTARTAVARLKSGRGADAVTAWNIHDLIGGDTSRREDPYFPFAESFRRWGVGFAAMNVGFRGATLVLDLLDRKGKYENGFMHGPVPAWRDRGTWRSARIQFTANAVAGQVGSGRRATETFFHEGGHAAHFANIDMPSPCFAQEFAPTSVALAEVQSMFFDSLLGDADWQTRYARTVAGEPMPWELIEATHRGKQPFAAWLLRAMLCVPYAERAIYEIPDEKLSPETILAAIREVERRLLFLDTGSPRPVLSVPHLLAGESSAYYHGYVLAEMAVAQTRAYFRDRDGYLTDNPRIGPDMAAGYWKDGNRENFAGSVRRAIGTDPSPIALADEVNQSVEQCLAAERASVDRLSGVPTYDDPVDLDATIRVCHGRETITSGPSSEFARMAEEFSTWVTGLERSAT